jgi:hypothetical protein
MRIVFPREGAFRLSPIKIPELQHRFVMKTALEDAVLPREIVALTTLPQSGFVQQPISLPIPKTGGPPDYKRNRDVTPVNGSDGRGIGNLIFTQRHS